MDFPDFFPTSPDPVLAIAMYVQVSCFFCCVLQWVLQTVCRANASLLLLLLLLRACAAEVS
jgi:hypothetical protein